MKINIDIDCTPEEARLFFGLPDVKPMQQAVMARIERQMLDAADAMSPDSIMKMSLQFMPHNPDQIRARSRGSSRSLLARLPAGAMRRASGPETRSNGAPRLRIDRRESSVASGTPATLSGNPGQRYGGWRCPEHIITCKCAGVCEGFHRRSLFAPRA